jgi:choline dehydrogenase-like flavoprotein
MHIDARKLPNNSIIEGDICIIGAGAAGISIALDWMDTPFKVILLEGGGFEYDEKVQNLYDGKTTGQKYFPIKSTRLHYFGGTTGHWAGMCAPFDDIDFKKRDWVPNSGWPINKKDLDPYYEKANKTLKLGLYNYEFDYWQNEFPNLNPFPLDDKVIWNKIWQFSQAHFGEIYKKTIVEAKNIHLYTYANAIDIKTDNNISKVNEVIVKNYAGKMHKVRARHFIMACGTIQNARLLLASNSQSPNGLGNNNDLVGRYFMEHIEIASAELWLSKSFQSDLYSWPSRKEKRNVRAELAISEQIQTKENILNGTISLVPLSVGIHQKPRMETWQDPDPRKSGENMFKNWGEASEKAKNEKGSIERAFMLNTRIEQSPNRNSRITIGPEKDELGVPRANLHWELSALDKRSIRKIYQILGHQVGISGIGHVRLKEFLRDENDDTFPDSTNGGWHHMGTTRMSEDPKKGVVNANCKVHGISNLYVAGGACNVTSGAANPTLTVTALSLRLSDHTKNKMKNQST